MAARPSSSQTLTALLVVGLGMLLIAALSSAVLWIISRRRLPVAAPSPEISMGEPAEA